MCKLDASGILMDHASIALRSVGKSAIVFDELPAPLRYAQRQPARRRPSLPSRFSTGKEFPVAPERTLTVTVDCALRASREQRTAADHAREHSPMAKIIPGYGRLP